MKIVDSMGSVEGLMGELQRALDGSGPALLPLPPSDLGRQLAREARLDEPLADDTALLLPTSGSTGAPKVVELSSPALLASATATHQRIGPPARWLLTLPLTHVAGWQVLVRSALASRVDRRPRRMDPAEPFTSKCFQHALRDDAGPPVRYVSLVPTQLRRLLDDSRLSAPPELTILLGGAAPPPGLLSQAGAQGWRVITTYGSTETCGGCLYDGLPLDGVRTDLRPDGRLALSGAVLATGYRGRPDDSSLPARLAPVTPLPAYHFRPRRLSSRHCHPPQRAGSSPAIWHGSTRRAGSRSSAASTM